MKKKMGHRGRSPRDPRTPGSEERKSWFCKCEIMGEAVQEGCRSRRS